MAIKKLQNNFTTPEQSKRLLELGVPADSADMVYLDNYQVPEMFLCTYSEYCENDDEYQSQCDYPNFHKFIPCWSVGRLMEIFDVCYQQGSDEDCITESWILTQEAEENFGSYIEYLIKTFEVQQNYLNFSKLEE